MPNTLVQVVRLCVLARVKVRSAADLELNKLLFKNEKEERHDNDHGFDEAIFPQHYAFALSPLVIMIIVTLHF